jgi:hypothetical protein
MTPTPLKVLSVNTMNRLQQVTALLARGSPGSLGVAKAAKLNITAVNPFQREDSNSRGPTKECSEIKECNRSLRLPLPVPRSSARSINMHQRVATHPLRKSILDAVFTCPALKDETTVQMCSNKACGTKKLKMKMQNASKTYFYKGPGYKNVGLVNYNISRLQNSNSY